jgi:hypothetical protein
MKPGIKKAGSGKKVWVATTFTGAAACAFAFAPAAAAGTGQPAPTGAGYQAGIRPDGLGVDESCPAGTSTWLHLVVLNDVKQWCVGGKGSHPLKHTATIIGLCGGNNSGRVNGHYRYSPPFGEPSSYIPFGPGERYRGTQSFIASSIYLYGWRGSDVC